MKKLRKTVISGGSWDPPGPVPMSAHKPVEYGCHMGRLSHTRPAPRLGLPIMGAALSLSATLSPESGYFFLLFPPRPPGCLHKRRVARQPSSLLSSWIPGNSVQANSQECTFSHFSSLAPGFPTKNSPGICLVPTFTPAIKSPSFCRLCIQNA